MSIATPEKGLQCQPRTAELPGQDLTCAPSSRWGNQGSVRSRSWKEGQTESIAQCRLPFLPYVPDTVPCFSLSVEIPDLQRENLVPGPASYSRRKIQRGRALAVLTAAHKGHQGRGRGQSDPGRILEGFKGEVISESGL